MNNEDKRAKFNQDAFDRSIPTEKYVNFLLKEYCPSKELNYIWYNKNGESYKSWDFALFEGKKVKALIEVEGKGYIYEEYYVKDGVDFIYRKVHRPYPIKCYYFMPIGSDEGYHYILYLTMDDIKKYGHKHRKYTGRDRNKKESFMRVPFDKCKKLSPSVKRI